MSIEQMRKMISGVYPGVEWASRVRCMKENQVLAIYTKFLDDGKFDKKEEEKSPWVQMTLF